MEYVKNINLEYYGDYNKQLCEIYEKFKNNINGFTIEKSSSESENVKICVVKDVDFVNYFEYKDFTIVLVKSECQVSDNYENNKRNYFWFKDDETLIKFFDFLLHVVCLKLQVEISLSDVFDMLGQKNSEKRLPVVEIANEIDLINSESNMFIALYCKDLGFAEINRKIESLFKPIKTTDYNIIFGIGSYLKINKEFIFSVSK